MHPPWGPVCQFTCPWYPDAPSLRGSRQRECANACNPTLHTYNTSFVTITFVTCYTLVTLTSWAGCTRMAAIAAGPCIRGQGRHSGAINTGQRDSIAGSGAPALLPSIPCIHAYAFTHTHTCITILHTYLCIYTYAHLYAFTHAPRPPLWRTCAHSFWAAPLPAGN